MVNFIFDFDSTLVTKETLNEMLKPLLSEEKQKEIDETTKLAMEGKITFRESLEKRLKIGGLNKNIVLKEQEITKQFITEGIENFIQELKNLKNTNIFIVSGGFKEIIMPTAKLLNIPETNIFANEFDFDKNENVIGAKDSLLLQKQGKVAIIQDAKNKNIIKGKSIMIGDGYTDLETYLYNAVDAFICFCGVVEREMVKQQSKYIAYDIQQLKTISFELYDKYLKE